jgi:hypothetical protein
MAGNGGETDRYTWTQTLQQVTVVLKHDIAQKRDLKVSFDTNRLQVLHGDSVLLDGELHRPIKPGESLWYLEGTSLVLELEKSNNMEWWSRVLVGDAEIDPSKCEPETSRLSDLDGETRQLVEKMMLQQRARMFAERAPGSGAPGP